MGQAAEQCGGAEVNGWPPSESLLQKMIDLCPDRRAQIWGMLRKDQDIVLEPTVGRKTTNEMRVSCRKRLLAD